MRPEALEEARDWLARADRDLLVADRSLRVAPPLPEQTAYHAQQAAEKALKAFLAAHDQPFPKTHDLERLVDMGQTIDPAIASCRSAAQTLTPYATEFRYPGGPLEPTQARADDALELAKDVVDFVRQRLGLPG